MRTFGEFETEIFHTIVDEAKFLGLPGASEYNTRKIAQDCSDLLLDNDYNHISMKLAIKAIIDDETKSGALFTGVEALSFTQSERLAEVVCELRFTYAAAIASLFDLRRLERERFGRSVKSDNQRSRS